MGAIKRAFANNITTGGNLDSLDAAKLTGTLADARFPSTLPAVSGASLTGISSGLTLLTSGDITSTTSTFVIDSAYVNDTYEHYMLILRGKDAGDGVQLNMRYRNDAGNASISDNYSYRIGEIADNGGGTNSEGESLIRLSYNHPGNAANEGFNMILHFLSPRSNLVPTTCQWTISHADSSDTFHVNHGAARRNDGTEKHGGFVLFFSNGGDFANGTNYELYGFKK